MRNLRIHLISGQSFNTEVYDDEYSDIYDQWADRRDTVLAFNQGCAHAKDVTAIEYLPTL